MMKPLKSPFSKHPRKNARPPGDESTLPSAEKERDKVLISETVLPAPKEADLGTKSLPPAKRPRGHPLAKIDPANLERLTGLGFSQEAVAAQLGINSKTLRRRLDKDPALVAALERGWAKRRETVAEGIAKLNKKGNVASLIYSSKQRIEHGGLGWSDRAEAPAVMGRPFKVVITHQIIGKDPSHLERPAIDVTPIRAALPKPDAGNGQSD
jgi:hypothetical protein